MNEAYNQKKSTSVPTSANLSTLNHFVSLAVANFVHPLTWMTASLEKHYSKGKSSDHIYSWKFLQLNSIPELKIFQEHSCLPSENSGPEHQL